MTWGRRHDRRGSSERGVDDHRVAADADVGLEVRVALGLDRDLVVSLGEELGEVGLGVAGEPSVDVDLGAGDVALHGERDLVVRRGEGSREEEDREAGEDTFHVLSLDTLFLL